MAKKQKKMRGLYVDVYNNNVEGALKKFKRKVKDSELMMELKERSYYEKPSRKRRRQKNLAISRQKYKQLKENETNY